MVSFWLYLVMNHGTCSPHPAWQCLCTRSDISCSTNPRILSAMQSKWTLFTSYCVTSFSLVRSRNKHVFTSHVTWLVLFHFRWRDQPIFTSGHVTIIYFYFRSRDKPIFYFRSRDKHVVFYFFGCSIIMSSRHWPLSSVRRASPIPLCLCLCS
jgi:hypothetical protein